MEWLTGSIAWVKQNWLTLIGVLVGVDQILKILAPLTKNTLDDNLADMLGKWVAKQAGVKP